MHTRCMVKTSQLRSGDDEACEGAADEGNSELRERIVILLPIPMRYGIILSMCVMVGLGGCRKDLKHWQLTEKIESHTSTDRLNRIYFVNDSLGFVVGGQRFAQSTILTTRDGGKTWSYTNNAQADKGLYGITSTAEGVLYAVGFDGKLLKSVDGGKEWKFYQTWYHPYHDLAFVSESKGIIVGGISFKTGNLSPIDSNGQSAYFDSTAYELNDIEMVDGKYGYISGYGVVLKTTDSGKNWELLNIQDENFKAIKANGYDEAWTCGYNGSIHHTNDGGKTWERLRNGNDISRKRYHLLDLVFVNQMEGYAVGEDGVMIYTDNGGRNWMEMDKFTNAHLRSIVALRDGSLMVCGDAGSLYRVRAAK